MTKLLRIAIFALIISGNYAYANLSEPTFNIDTSNQMHCANAISDYININQASYNDSTITNNDLDWFEDRVRFNCLGLQVRLELKNGQTVAHIQSVD